MKKTEKKKNKKKKKKSKKKKKKAAYLLELKIGGRIPRFRKMLSPIKST